MLLLSTSVQLSVITTFQQHIATMSELFPSDIDGITKLHRTCLRNQLSRRMASSLPVPAQPAHAPRLPIVHISAANTNTVIDPTAPDSLLAELETISLPFAPFKIEPMVDPVVRSSCRKVLAKLVTTLQRPRFYISS